jgi:hypothetical protein
VKPRGPVQEIYRREGSWALIELTLDQPAQLFNSLDPAPFRQRDLDPDAAEYIIDAVRELHGHREIKLVVHLPDVSDPRVHVQVAEAIAHYFRYQAQAARLTVRNTLRLGRASLIVGLLFLVVCVAGAQLIFTHDNVLSDLLHEGLLIVGWVAMWRPLDILLYEWWPLLRDARMYARIAQMPVELRQRG